jgi:UDP-2-acetamido-2,6-beta-L-arabino-hexul-4-ose reductase
MKIGVTGSDGFIGWHLRCYLKTKSEIDVVKLAGREVFKSQRKLRDFVLGLDVIVHLAGVNRSDPEELILGNKEPAVQLVDALVEERRSPLIVYTSSTQAEAADTPYGKGKAAASEVFRNWSEIDGNQFINLVVPHVYGEYGRPHYNSVVATFVHQVAVGQEPSVKNNGQLELIHVQDLVEEIVNYCLLNESGEVRIKGQRISVNDVANKMKHFRNVYIEQQQYPDLSTHFDRCMFNTFRGAIDYGLRQHRVMKHEDDRGWLVETIKANSGGQCFVSSTKPGVTRGNHFHLRKIERFFVLAGQAEVKVRKLFTDDVITYLLDGDDPSYVDIPTMHTHCISNVGPGELLTLFWTDEIYDEKNPDTVTELVTR